MRLVVLLVDLGVVGGEVVLPEMVQQAKEITEDLVLLVRSIQLEAGAGREQQEQMHLVEHLDQEEQD